MTATPAVTHAAPTFEELYATYYPRILAYTFRLLGSREDAEDATQETFLKIARALPTLAPEYVSAWVYCIASHSCADLLRQRRRQQAHRCREDFETATRAVHDGGDLPERTVGREQLRQAWHQVPPSGQAVLRRLLEGHTPQEIARERGVSLSSIKQRAYRARCAFRQAYREVSA